MLTQAKRVLIVTDGFMASSGRTSYVTDLLPDSCQWEIFSEITPDPDVDTITKGTAKVLGLAGMAFSNSGLGICHAMAHALGALAHVPHGRANAMLLPHIMRYNADCQSQKLTPVAKKYAIFSAEMGLGASNTRQSAVKLIRTVERYLRDMKIPRTLEKAKVDVKMVEAAIPQMAQAALADACMATTPGVLPQEKPPCANISIKRHCDTTKPRRSKWSIRP